MSDMIGKFGRFWEGERPLTKYDYQYGYLIEHRGYSSRRSPMVRNGGHTYEHFEPAEAEPTFPSPPRRLIADRARLARILLDGGWVPVVDGSFVRPSKNDFVPEMWRCCGGEVYYRGGGCFLKTDLTVWTIEHEWTEPYDD